MGRAPWFKSGLKFECQNSGNCCISRGQYGHVYLTTEDRQRLAHELGLSLTHFTKKYCQKEDGFFKLKEDPTSPACLFLKNHRCQVYRARPTQCRTWPFWPETLRPKSWQKEVVEFCPGANKGRVYTAQEILEQKQTQIESEKKMLNERTSS